MVPQLIEPQFHAGELAAQQQAGVAPRGSAIRDAMPDQHRLFFLGLPFLLVATTDEAGWPFATMLAGAPGFVGSPERENVDHRGSAGCRRSCRPVAALWRAGRHSGHLATRRRNRANGIVVGVDMDGFTVLVRESFGNCPQYIHVRDVALNTSTARQPTETLEGLDPAAHAAITAADTLFVATSGREKGVDISHRAGKPGFVQIDGNTLTIPDYAGNRYFNTLGNLQLDPRAALLFPDFTSGDLLLVQGSTEVQWEIPEEQRVNGAERLWKLTVDRAWRRRGAVPLRLTLRAMSTSPG